MGSPFDVLRDNVFDTIKNVFGYECSWTAIDGGASYTGKVNFQNPTEVLKNIGVQYDENDWMMEYREGDFAGLFERVEKRNTPAEVVTIDSNNYYVMAVIQVHDGATYRAVLKPTNNDLTE